MSVRRLADPSVQPPVFAFSGAMQPRVETWISKYPAGRQQSAVIPLLMLAQEQEGWVTKASIEHVADMLDMPYIRVLEVATFYTQFQLQPVGTKAHIQVCGTTPCMLRGSEELMDVCRSKIHHDQFHTNESGTLSWEEVECLGACVNAPMVMVFKDTYEDLTPEKLAEIIDAFEAGNPPAPGPQVDRFYSAPATGFTSLADEDAIKRDARAWQNREAQPNGGEQHVAPSNAAKPKTDTAETNVAVKSPSPEKTTAAAEKATSVEAPKENGVAANTASTEVEKTVKQRKARTVSADADKSKKAPELMKGEPIGADSKAAPDAGKPGTASAGNDEAAKPARRRTTKRSDTGEAS